MKSFALNRPIVCLLLLLFVPVLAPGALTHRWQFNETSGTNLVDSVGTANADVVVLAGGGGYSLSNNAIRLGGGTRSSADYVEFTGNVFDGLSNCTIEIWAEPHDFLNQSRLIDMGDGAVNPTTNNFRLTWVNGANGNQQFFGVRGYPPSVSSLATTSNQMYHYAIVWQAGGGPGGQGVVSWYRDGAFVTNQLHGTSSIAAIANLPSPIVWLGRSPFAADAGASATYHELRVYSHALSPTEINISRTNGPNSLITPPTQAGALTMVTNTNSRLTLNWANGAGSVGTIVVMSPFVPPTRQPTNGVTYAASNVFGAGANLGASNFVVYAGSGTSVTVTNLIPGARYYAAAYSYSGSGGGTIYNLAEAPAASEVVFAQAQSISLQTPGSLTIFGTAQSSVTANFGSGITGDVTTNAAYSSSAPGVVAVSATGGLQAVGYGSAWITASYQGQLASNAIVVFNPLTNNLVHRYPFAEDASDIAGTAHGTLAGGAFIATNHVIFNGAGAFVNLPNNLVTGLTSITIETWVADLGSGNWGRIFDFGNNNAGEDLQGTGTQYLFMALPSGAGNLRAAITTSGNAGEQLCEWTGNRPAVGAQAHIVLTLDDPSNVARLYVNGVQVGVNSNLTLTPAALGPTVNNWLGKSVWPDPFFNGTMDEFRVYNLALPASLVLTNYLNGPDGIPTAPPVVADDAVTLNPGAKALVAVLVNDPGPAISTGTLDIVTPPANGGATINPGGKILYTHNGSPTTSDIFTYRVQNVFGETSTVATVSLVITNALRLAAPTLAMPSSPPAVGYQFVDAFPGLFFEDAVAIHSPPESTNQIFVAERRGRISYVPDINATTPQRLVFLDIVNQVSFDNTAEGEMGLLGMAFHPGFKTNGYFFVYYMATNPVASTTWFDRVARFQADPVALTVNTNTQQLLFAVSDEEFNHNGGDLHFGNDGYLYVGMGDEGQQYNLRQNSQRIDKDLFSALLRIDVDKQPGNPEPRPSANTTTIYTNGAGLAFYSIPANNPFVNATTYLGSPVNTNTLRAEMFATGFRHIWRFSIDAPTGDIWVGDVGQDRYEEVNIATNGGNYGWAYLEGYSNTVALYPTQPTLLSNPPPGFVPAPPLYAYAHAVVAGGDPQFKGNSISGGVVYRGNKIPELNGAYIFGDFESTHIWALRRTNNSVAVQRLGGVIAAAGFGQDPGNGDVLVANYVMNRIERLIRVDTGDSSFPQKLSDTGVFADLADLAPNPGLVNYEPIVAFWSDHALKRRWFGIPGLSPTVTHVADGNWTLPTGMVWVKHFDLERERGNPATKQRLETRFVVKTTDSIYGVSYAWNAAGTEAFLVSDGGTNFNLTITNGLTTLTQQWGIPSRSACLVCHTEVGGRALSFNTRQLNQTSSMNGFVGNQLGVLSAAGYFANPISAPQTLPSFAKANDASVSLEHRVRSYLSVNCVQCHQTGGAGPATWDARAWLGLEQTALLNGTPDNNAGIPANKLIVPGDAVHSVVLQRIRGNGFSRMPPLATAVIDEAATNLLHAWISTELTNRQTFAEWQLANFGSTNAPNALAGADPDNDRADNYYEYLTQTSPLNAVPPPWTIAIDENAGTVGVSFQRLANLGFVVETSTNFMNWAVWDVPENTLWFSAANFVDTITGPLLGETNVYFRVKLVEP